MAGAVSAEWFLNNLSANQEISGFTDVYFCPLLATDLSKFLMKMLANNMQGLYHVVSRDCSSKYNFGQKLARLFGYDPALIRPKVFADSGLIAKRSLNLTLRADKLSRDLDKTPPDLDSCMERYHQQFLDGYPQAIQAMQG